MKIFLIAVCCLGFFLPSALAKNDLSFDGIVRNLCDAGTDKPTATLVAETLAKVSKSENIDPIIELLGNDEHAGNITVALLGATGKGRLLLMHILDKHNIQNPECVVYALLFAKEKEVVDYLIARLESDESEATKMATVFVLRVICSQDIDDASAWRKWWNKNRRDFNFPDDINYEERCKKMQTEAHRLCLEKIDDTEIVIGSAGCTCLPMNLI